VLDTCVEFAAMTAGKRRKDQGRSLVAALTYLGLSHIDQEEKDDMRALALMERHSHEYTSVERSELIRYCWSDVEGVAELLAVLEEFLCK
jgi:hypothetical protein